MLRALQVLSGFDLQRTLDRIDETKQMTRADYLNLSTCLLSDFKMSDEQRRQINRFFDYLPVGRLKLVDR